MSKSKPQAQKVAQSETAANPSLTRRETLVLTGAVASTAALGVGPSTISAADTVDFESDLASNPSATGSITLLDVDSDLGALEVYDSDDEVVVLADYGFQVAPEPDSGAHNPVSFDPSAITADELTAINWQDASQWSGSATETSSGSGITIDGSATLTVDVSDMTSADAQLQLIADVNGSAITATPDDGTAIDLSQGDEQLISESLSTSSVTDLSIDASTSGETITIHGLRISDSPITLGVEETSSSETSEISSATGTVSIQSLESLRDGLSNVSLSSVTFDVERVASQLPASEILVMDTDLNDDGSEIRAEIATIFDDPAQFEAVDSVSLSDLTDEIALDPADYREVGAVDEAGTVENWEDVDALSLEDSTTAFEDGATGDSVTLLSGSLTGTTVVYQDVEVSSDEFDSLTTSAGGGGLIGGDGLSWAWSLVVGSAVGILARFAQVRGWFGSLLG